MYEELLDNLVRIIVSNRTNKNIKYKKIVIKPVMIKETLKYQLECYTETQVVHQNMTMADVITFLEKVFINEYKQIDCFQTTKTISLKASNKGQVQKTIRENAFPKEINLTHDRVKNQLLPEGTVILPLVDLGIMDETGLVIKRMYHKYRQIERFLEMINDVIKDETELNIIDFGCGKSYLTFIVYYFLVKIKKIKVHMVGLDLKEDVIEKCQLLAKKYEYHDLHFEKGDISLYHADFPVDMIMTLHACDVATDYALYHAIAYQTKYIFSVPCCQHEINAQMKEKASIITKYGLFKERFSALLTDAIRAQILEFYDYNVDVLEFIEWEATPKNVLLRAKKGKTSTEKKALIIENLKDTMQEFSIIQTLYNLTIGKL